MNDALQLGLVGGLLVHNRLIEQSRLVSSDRFLRVLQPEDIFLGNSGIFFRLFTELLQQGNAPRVEFEGRWILHIAQKVELRHGEQAPRIARMSGYKNQLAIFHSGWRPLQVVIEVHRFAIFVDAEERDVEIVARIGEVVGVAAEESDVEFRREHKADVRVFLVLVQVVDLPGVKDCHIAAQSRRGGTILFHLRHRGALSLAGVRRRHPRLHAGIDLVSDILDADQLVQLQIRALCFLSLRLGIKASLDVVVALGRELLDAACSDVMVGEGQAVGRNERARAAVVKSHRRQANMIEPLLCQLKTILGLDFVFWGSVIQPHAFVGRGQSGKHKCEREQNRKKTFHIGRFLHKNYEVLLVQDRREP